MKRISLFSISLLFIGIILSGQEKNILLTINEDHEVSLDAFKWMYHKNNEESAGQDPESYLQTYIDFKLKVTDAMALGLDADPGFIREYNEYKNTLAESYLPHRVSERELLIEAYERANQDVNASHILLTIPQNPSPEDTIKVYKRIMEIRTKILEGNSFEKMARSYSEDPAADVNGGHLNWQTVFSLAYPLETILYTTPINEVSMPVRTAYGYHLVKVHKRRKSPGLVKVSHIYVQSTPEMSEEARQRAEVRIWQVYDSLMMGADFNSLNQSYSEDKRYAQDGGEMPWFGVGQMVPEFEEAAFALMYPGEITRPVQTPYGWHIIRLLERKSIDPYDKMRPWLEDQVRASHRLEYHKNTYEKQIIDAYGLVEYPEVLGLVCETADSSLLVGEWDGASLQQKNTPLLTIGKRSVSTGEFVSYVVKKQDAGRRARNAAYYVNELYEQFKPLVLHQYQKSQLPVDFPEFKYEIQEYHDGLLLFEIMDQKVWSKAVTDQSGLKSYFESNRERYMWGERTDAYILTCQAGADIENVRKKYKKILSGSLDAAALNEKYCSSDSVACIKLAHVLTEKGVYPRVDAQNGVIGPGPVYENSNSNGFVIIKEVRSPEPKQLDEARGDVVSDYQNYLEETWIEEIRQKYPVVINKEVLKQLAP